MEDNLPKDEFKISEDKLKEYLQSSQKDPDYEVLSEKNRSRSGSMRDELLEMIEKVHQSLSKLDKSTESQTERCIDLLEKLSGACAAQTKVLAEHERSIEQLQKIVKSDRKTIAILTGLTLLSMSWSLIVLATNFTAFH
ncbi:hypothetical protein [Chamaesiphon sp. VAR_48_metabat_403]|uniref:hypothetical protein n=1 Tax=Chamaesiphon sp. VAR_48_metabat_403 TaxID=2964700 RepID=UPI00286D739A|nr:hypothetical protein [Chamaesiphon sp. VAR_48_metabat_403]